MRTRRNVLILAAAVIVVLIVAAGLRQFLMPHAQFDHKNVIFETPYTLTDRHADDLVVVGSDITLSPSSQVAGNASLAGDNVQVAGTVEGDLNMLGGNVTVSPGAQVNGNANLAGTNVIFGGTVAGKLLISGDHITLLPDAQIAGTVDVCSENIVDQRAAAPPVKCLHDGFNPFAALIALRETSVGSGTLGARLDLLAAGLLAGIGIVLLTGASALAVTLFPHQVSRIEEAIRSRPRSFCGIGLATYALGIGLAAALTLALALLPPLGLLLLPLFLILALLLFVFSLSGLITLALILGDGLVGRFTNAPLPPLIAAVIGSLALALPLAGIALLPFGFAISLIALSALSSVGLGASLFTRVGTRSVRRTYFVQG